MAIANGGDDYPVCSETGVQFARTAVARQAKARRIEGPRGLGSGGSGGDDGTVGLNGKGEGARIVGGSAEVSERNSLLAEGAIDAAVGIVANDSEANVVVSQGRTQLAGDGAAHHNLAVILQHQRRCRGHAWRRSRRGE